MFQRVDRKFLRAFVATEMTHPGGHQKAQAFQRERTHLKATRYCPTDR